jgi:hypothetical protein
MARGPSTKGEIVLLLEHLITKSLAMMRKCVNTTFGSIDFPFSGSLDNSNLISTARSEVIVRRSTTQKSV